MGRVLVLYYSWSNGNTERVAQTLADACDADIERIETVVPYPEDYNTTVDQGKREVESGFEPQLQPLDHNPADYDAIAVGTPTWWYTMAPAVRTLMSSTKWSGKVVVPFSTCGGWEGTTLDDIAELAEGAQVAQPFTVTFGSDGGSRMVTDPRKVEAWAGRVAALA
ncbi:MAG: flavodoxin [Coriobacteriales bacterium]|nr:flavodoxin [Coriobacteriales bacterium]